MDEYIVFVLGVDSSKISNIIRNKLSEISDLQEIYNVCRYIARVFEHYVQDYVNTMSKIESFYYFLSEYEDQIIAYIEGDSNEIILRSEENE